MFRNRCTGGLSKPNCFSKSAINSGGSPRARCSAVRGGVQILRHACIIAGTCEAAKHITAALRAGDGLFNRAAGDKLRQRES